MNQSARPAARAIGAAAIAMALLLTSCGSGGSDEAGSSDTTAPVEDSPTTATAEADDDENEEATTTTAPEEPEGGPSDEFCTAAEPLFPTKATFDVQTPESAGARVAIYRAMAAASEGETATQLEALAATIQTAIDAGNAASTPLSNTEVREAAALCAASEVEISWDGTAISGVPADADAGLVAFRGITTGGETALAVVRLQDGQEPLDAFGGELSDNVVVLSQFSDEQLLLAKVDAGRYVIGMGSESSQEPTAESVGILTVE